MPSKLDPNDPRFRFLTAQERQLVQAAYRERERAEARRKLVRRLSADKPPLFLVGGDT